MRREETSSLRSGVCNIWFARRALLKKLHVKTGTNRREIEAWQTLLLLPCYLFIGSDLITECCMNTSHGQIRRGRSVPDWVRIGKRCGAGVGRCIWVPKYAARRWRSRLIRDSQESSRWLDCSTGSLPIDTDNAVAHYRSSFILGISNKAMNGENGPLLTLSAWNGIFVIYNFVYQ